MAPFFPYNATRMRLLALGLIVLLARPVTGAELRSLDAAYGRIEDAYPTSRLVGGTLSIITGALTGFGGTALLFNESRPMDERLVGGLGSILGAITGGDGLVRSFSPSSMELIVPH